jgi:hypothetical protein
MMVVADTVSEPREWSWYAAALGDTCLFHVRDERLISAFPLDDVAAFGVSPALAGSRNRDMDQLAEHTALASGSCRPGAPIVLGRGGSCATSPAATRSSHPGLNRSAPGTGCATTTWRSSTSTSGEEQVR